MTSPLPPKKDVALALIERSSVFVYLDPRREGVVTPAGFKREPKLVLQVGLNMAVPIRDLTFDDSGMSCTLSFNRTPFFCVIPWGAVFALTDENGQGMVWPDDVPRELVEAQAQAQAQAPRRAALRVVKDDEPAPEAAHAPTPEPAAEAPSEAEKAPKKAKKASAKPSKEKEKTAAPAEPPTKRARAAKSAEGAEAKATTNPAKKARTKKAAEAAPEPAPAKAAKKAPAAAKPAPEPPRKAPEQVGLFDGAEPRPAEPPPVPRPAPGGKPKRELPPYLRVVK